MSGGIGKFSQFIQDIKENASTSLTARERSRDLNGGDTKANTLFSSKKPSQTSSAKAKARSHSTTTKNQTIKTLIRNVANKVLAKLQHPPGVVKQTFTQSTSTPTKAGQKPSPRDAFLQTFSETALHTLAATKNTQAALQDTIGMLEKADKAGILDQDLYKTVTTRLDRSIEHSCRRQSISLDDTTTEKSIHTKLLEASPGNKRFEKFANIEELTGKLATHLKISPDEAKQAVEKAFEHYPQSNEITFSANGEQTTALLVVDDQAKADLQIKGKHLASGASSVVHESYSLRNQAPVATKYATALAADTDEEKQAKKVQEHILTKNQETPEGTTKPMTLVGLNTPEGSATVATGYLYAGDASTPAENELLRSSEKALESLIEDLQLPGDKENKAGKISDFFQTYGPILTENHGAEMVAQLRSSLETA